MYCADAANVCEEDFGALLEFDRQAFGLERPGVMRMPEASPASGIEALTEEA